MSAWRIAAYRAIRPLLFATDPEAVHHAALSALSFASGSLAGRAACRLASGVGSAAASRAPVSLLGLPFRNRIGLGAGFDKDGVAIRGWATLGFGFVELGTVTPRPQPGNPKPRLFRLPADGALINRMGFNNAGADALALRIADARPHLPEGFVVGVNIGRNRDGSVDDYPAAARLVGPVADYLAINVSSPNTPGLRQLQEPEQLVAIIEAVADAAPGRPILVKLSPDVGYADRRSLLARLAGSPAAGVIVSNTTVTRAVRTRRLAREAGGLSGRPLLPRTITAVEQATAHGMVVVASGGASSGADARALFDAGADLVQLWTGLIYAGPGLIRQTVRR